MPKTKMGVSVGLLGAGVCFSGMFGWYIPMFLLTGYVLLMEENEWLRKACVKGVVVTMFFTLISVLVGLVPEALGALTNLVNAFGGTLSTAAVSWFVSAILSIISIVRCIILALLGVKALGQGIVSFPVADKMTEKHM